MILDLRGPIPTISPDGDTVRQAAETCSRYGLHFYDGMILAAAEQAGCTKIWWEDLNAGQVSSESRSRIPSLSYSRKKLEQAGLAAGEFAAKVLVGAGSGNAATRGAIEHAHLHEIGLVHFLDGVFFFAESGGEGAETDGPAGIFIEESNHQIAVDLVEAVLIDAEHVERLQGDFAGDAAASADFGEVTGAAKKAVGDARRAAAASGDFFGAGVVHLDVQNFRGAVEDDEEIPGLVEIEAMDNAKAGAKRRGDKPGASGGADESEMTEMEGMDARARSLANHQVDAKIFHRGVENFFDGGLKAMDFVEKKYLARLEGRKDGGEVALAFEKRAGAGLDGNIEFVGDNLRERGFAKAGRAVQKDVIKSFAAIAGGFEGDGNVFLDAFLADVFGKSFRADTGVEARVVVRGSARDDTGDAIRVFVGAFFLWAEVCHVVLSFLWGAKGCKSSAQKSFEIGRAGLALGFRDGGFGSAFVVAEIDERGFDVGGYAGLRSGGRLFSFDGDGFELVLEFDDHALSGFAANAGNFRETGKITGADRGDEFFDVHAGKDFESEGGANA